MAISTNQKPTIYRNLYENTGPGGYIDVSIYHMTPKTLNQKVSQEFSILLDIVNDPKKLYRNLTHKSPEIQDGRHWP